MMKHKRKRRTLGASSAVHEKTVLKKLRDVRGSITQGHREINQGRCADAFDSVRDAELKFGAAAAHASGASRWQVLIPKFDREVSALAHAFSKRCVMDRGSGR